MTDRHVNVGIADVRPMFTLTRRNDICAAIGAVQWDDLLRQM